MIKTDSIDEQIVRILGEDGKKTNNQIAEELNVSAATVRRRVKKLMDNDMLRFVGVVDPVNFGYKLPVVIALDVVPDKLDKAIDLLDEYREVEWIAPTTGRYDVIAGMLFKSMDDLSNFLRNALPNIEGIKDSEVFICLKGKKKGYYQVLA